MHELSIVMNIVDIVTEELDKHGNPGEVEKVCFSAGKMHAIIRESLIFNYDVVKMNYPVLKDSVLEFREIPVLCECNECGRKFSPDDTLFVCPDCDSPMVELISGKEMSVDSIEIKDND